MCMDRILKPSYWTFAIFSVLVVVFIWFFAANSVSIFPCTVQPVIPNPPAAIDSLCPIQFGPYMLVGARHEFTVIGYLLIAFAFLIVPYLLAVLLEENIFAKKRKKG
ncbi:MAG: hypothetical protein ABH863_04600 [Candidatus Micrarchaeota archaeon]